MKEYTLEEVRKHTNPETGVWIIFDDHVYDVTNFQKHPGQFDILLLNAGKDATKKFNDIHSEKAKKMREKFLIGKLKKPSVSDPSYEVENIVPESDVPRYYYLLPICLFCVFLYFTWANNH
jgi:cytochrome b involved in lipid metabolism